MASKREKTGICPKCYTRNPIDQTYCGNCGAPLKGEQVISFPSVPVSFSFWATTLLLIFAVIYLVLPFDFVPFTIFDDIALLGTVFVLWLWVVFFRPTSKKVVKE